VSACEVIIIITITTSLALFLLNETKNLICEVIVFGTRVCEDVDERVGQ